MPEGKGGTELDDEEVVAFLERVPIQLYRRGVKRTPVGNRGERAVPTNGDAQVIP